MHDCVRPWVPSSGLEERTLKLDAGFLLLFLSFGFSSYCEQILVLKIRTRRNISRKKIPCREISWLWKAVTLWNCMSCVPLAFEELLILGTETGCLSIEIKNTLFNYVWMYGQKVSTSIGRALGNKQSRIRLGIGPFGKQICRGH